MWRNAGSQSVEGFVGVKPGKTVYIKTNLKVINLEAIAWQKGYEPLVKNGVKVLQNCGTDKGDKGKGGDKSRGSGAKTGGDEPVVASVVPMVVSEFDYSALLLGATGVAAIAAGSIGLATSRHRRRNNG